MKKISVVICTANRTSTLIENLSGLKKQSEKNFELIIINANKSKQLYKFISELQSNTNWIRTKHIPVDFFNLPKARNVGVLHSKYNIVAFLDDDAIPNPNWVKSILVFFKRFPKTQVVGGRLTDKKYTYISDFLGKCYDIGAKRKKCRTIMGANFAVNRSAIRKIGITENYFNTTTTTAGDETEFCFKVINNDGSVIYEPKIRALHQNRSTIKELVKRQWQYALGDYQVMFNSNLSMIHHYVLPLKSKKFLLISFFYLPYVLVKKTIDFCSLNGWKWFPLSFIKELVYISGLYYAYFTSKSN